MSWLAAKGKAVAVKKAIAANNLTYDIWAPVSKKVCFFCERE